MLIKDLLKRQEKNGGYLDDEDLKDAAKKAGVPPYRVEELVSFFPHFRRTPPPLVVVQVCRDMTCHLRGAERLRHELATRQSHDPLVVEVRGVSCLGRCDRGPAMCVGRYPHPKKPNYSAKTPEPEARPIELKSEAVAEETFHPHERYYLAGEHADPEEVTARFCGIVEQTLAVTKDEVDHKVSPAEAELRCPAADKDEALDGPEGWTGWKINPYGTRNPERSWKEFDAVRQLVKDCRDAFLQATPAGQAVALTSEACQALSAMAEKLEASFPAASSTNAGDLSGDPPTDALAVVMKDAVNVMQVVMKALEAFSGEWRKRKAARKSKSEEQDPSIATANHVVTAIAGIDNVQISPERRIADVKAAVTSLRGLFDQLQDSAGDPSKDAPAPEEFQIREDVVAKWMKILKTSGLFGMGGGGLAAAGKWTNVRDSVLAMKRSGTFTNAYIVANGDESEPGTFKDRDLMLRCPELVLEGVILAGLLTGATKGYIYIRHEYHEQIKAIEDAIVRAEEAKICGSDVLQTGMSFPVEVFPSPGGYICGEQSALLEAMESKRAQPREKPPDLSANGLFGLPTLVSNVETFAWAPAVFLEGRVPNGWYASRKQPLEKDRQGWRLFSISGDVKNSGVYEMGVAQTLGDLIRRAGGVVGGDDNLYAVAASGPSGGFIPRMLPIRGTSQEVLEALDLFEKRGNPAEKGAAAAIKNLLDDEAFAAGQLDILRLPLELNVFRSIDEVIGVQSDMLLGAGLVVYAKSDGESKSRALMLDQAVNATEFFKNESCGKCVPCRLGSKVLAESARGLIGGVKSAELPILSQESVCELDDAMEYTSICSLGKSAGKPLRSWFEHFKDATFPATPVPAAETGKDH